ncbi:MAG: hypothetical protein F2889_03765 [Actinobacteria bacterium]|uniref:Unannotated protein n=1 Tax=freshwater metagenome TaxID=449393 RepID=A0A6J7AMF5_9ZZZZ|nr:hypothetical protein [Actinomycetota bacterium]MSX64424.1 hypothetical protein [Actinomycetota bacterium]
MTFTRVSGKPYEPGCTFAHRSRTKCETTGGGYRGGPIFPSTFLGVAVGFLGSLVFPEISVTAMAATGIAATATVMLRLPFTSALLAMVLLSSSGPAVAPFAIKGAVVGFGVRQGLDKRYAKRTSKLELERL